MATKQATLFEEPPPVRVRVRQPSVPRKLSLQEQFDEWIVLNPQVLEIYLRFARQARDAGVNRWGIGAITERVRWHTRIDTKGDEFKINNNWRSFLARLLVQRDPSLASLFEFRALATERRIKKQ